MKRILIPVFLLILSNTAQSQWGGMNAEFAGGGARAMAMGGAFIALADDATATEFNPAGLWQLRRPEIAAQIVRSFDERRTGLLASTLETGEAVFQTDEDAWWTPSFASIVYPMQHLALGVSAFTNVHFDRSHTDPAQGVRIHEKARNHAYGLTLAGAPTDRLSLGATVRYNTFRYEFQDGLQPDAWKFSDDDFTYNLGVLWKLHRRIHLGAVYKSPQRLRGSYRGMKVDTELPDTFGVGIAWLPNDAWRLLLDVDRIRWSRFDSNPQDEMVRDDVWRYHLGGEWHAGTWKETALFLRGGYFYEESNAFRYQGDNPILSDLTSNRDSIHHASLGFGIARPGYQLDFAVDLTLNNGQDLIASLVWYF